MIKSTRECLQMIDEIEEHADDLTEWEQQFIGSVGRQEKLSYKQREIIDRIHREKVKA